MLPPAPVEAASGLVTSAESKVVERLERPSIELLDALWPFAASDLTPELRTTGQLAARYLCATAPRSAQPGTRFVVGAQLVRQALAQDLWIALRPFDIPEGGRALAIDAHVSGSTTLLSHASYPLRLLPEEDSDPARFEFEAAALGQARITLRAFALPSDYLGQITLSIDIEDRLGAGEQTVKSAPIDASSLSDRTALLEINPDAEQRRLTFTLRGPAAMGQDTTATLTLAQPLSDVARGLQHKLDTIAKGTPLSPMAIGKLLAGTGADLWKRMVPSTIRSVLLDNLDAIDTLMIVGADDPIPWELLFPSNRIGFLSDRLLVTRWQFGGTRQLRIGAGSPRYVLPETKRAPPAALAEIDLVEALVGKGRRISALDDLLGELDLARFGLLHFAAHNIVDRGMPATTWVKLDQPFQQAMLGANYDGHFQGTAPLVFMNACNSSATELMWVGATGWPGRFLSAGAGAFVGSMWQVRDGGAKDFAARFYGGLAKGQSLGQAFSRARQGATAQGDPTRLGYTMFGHPAATMTLTREEVQ